MMLENINSPIDLKKLNKSDIPVLAEEIREFIIKNVSTTGGHLASNLCLVDLTLVLHYLFDSPKDSIVFDVGHQAYTHKILTGRRELFHTLRSYNGISGFPKRAESPHDIAETGHASTSISFALGLSTARKKIGEEGDVIAIIGDGAMTGGLALEAMNNISHVDNDLIVIVNNNEMSIGNNIGIISKTLNTTFNDKIVQDIYIKIKEMVSAMPFGKIASDVLSRLEGSIRSFITPSVFFRELGFKYFGPVNGHNYDELFETFEKVKQMDGPRIIQVNTTKGKGYSVAEKNPARFHGIAPFDIETGTLKTNVGKTFSSLFGECIVSAAKGNDNIIAITAAMEGGTGLSDFTKLFPDRFYDVGIAESHATTFAVGMSQTSVVPIVAIYSTFMQRAVDQAIHDVGIMNANVKFMVDRAGLVPEDGDTHQGIYDIPIFKIIPNFTIFAPVAEYDFRAMFDLTINMKGPTLMRYPKEAIKEIDSIVIPEHVSVGKCHVVNEGHDAVVISYGTILNDIYSAIKNLKKDITLVNLVTLKPLDELGLVSVCRDARRILIIEECVLEGGVGETVMQVLSKNNVFTNTPKGCGRIKIHAIENKFIEVGSRDKLLSIYKLDYDGVYSVMDEYFNLS